MKSCPQCGREYDTSMMFCLDDGAELLYGPGSDEPATAMLRATDTAGNPATPAQTHTTARTAVMPSGLNGQSKKHVDKRLLAATLLLAIVALVVFVGYRYIPSPSKQIESIAVMPFVNESGNPEIEYLSDGMTETLIKSLSNLPTLNVKPRSSVFRYKGKDTDLQTIAKELNVQAILNGRVAQRGDQLTLSIELIDVQNDRVIWTEQYQRKQSDLVSLQSEIARDVSSRLTNKLSGAEEIKVTKAATADPEAYQAYLKGRYYWNRRTSENLKKASEQFKLATDRDPNYALALVGLADCHAVSNEYSGTPSSESLPQAKMYADRALSIDPQLAEAHATLGLIANNLWQFAEAEKEFKRAIEINPNYATAYHWYSIFLKDVGRYDEAAVTIKRAKELDPLSSVIAVNVTRIYQLQNNDDAAIENSLQLIEIDPTFGPAYEYVALSYLRKGRHADALVAAEKAVELSKRSAVSLGDLGFVYAMTGKRPEASAVLKELEGKYDRREGLAQYVASVYAGLGDRDKAFEWLEKDIREKTGKSTEVRWQIPFDSLRDDQRYKDLLKRMGLPE